LDKINKLRIKKVLSIGIPIHNGADFIIDTINSVRNSDSKIPIIISNNFSTDQLIPKLNKYKKDRNEKNINFSNTKELLTLTDNIKRTIKIAKYRACDSYRYWYIYWRDQGSWFDALPAFPHST
jgi:glycosyltransferase involved in cell wall biosynthesis